MKTWFAVAVLALGSFAGYREWEASRLARAEVARLHAENEELRAKVDALEGALARSRQERDRLRGQVERASAAEYEARERRVSPSGSEPGVRRASPAQHVSERSLPEQLTAVRVAQR